MMESGGAQGGVGLIVWERPQGWSIESMRFHGMKMVIFRVATHVKRTPTIYVYLPTSTLEHLTDLEEALTCFRDQYTIVLGDLNADTNQSQNPCNQKVADLLIEFGMMDLLHKFWKCWRFQNVKMWSQVNQGRLMR